MYKYIRQFGEFLLVEEETGKPIHYKGEKVLGIAVSIDSETKIFCLHKHGCYDWVKKWFDETRAKYIEHGYKDMADDMRLVRVEHCLLEDLNKILSTSALPVSFLDRLETIENETPNKHNY